jgi:alpha-L-fucosidase
MNVPTEAIQVKSLCKLSKYSNKAIASISMLGSKEKIQWKQGKEELSITKPVVLPTSKVITFAVTFKN